MRPWVLEHLACPACRDGALAIERRDEVHRAPSPDDDADTILVEGVLRCGGCGARYPVLDESPRMLPDALLVPEERAILAAPRRRPGSPPPEATQLTQAAIDEAVRRRIMSDYDNPVAGPPLRRARAEIDYQLRYVENRTWQMQFLARQAPGPHGLVVDVGGGRGGNLNAARGVLPFRRGMVLDMDAHWPPLFRTGDRSVVYVRADATRLPLRSRCASLAMSSFLLEHVRAWEEVVREVARAAPVAFVAFGPNPAFPYEFGHIDAPLAHTLPAPAGALAALLWDQVSGNRRSYARLRAIIADMHWVSSRRYYAFCRRQRMATENLFTSMMEAWSRGGGSRLRRSLARRPALVRTLARSLSALHLEPNIYSLIRQPDGTFPEEAAR